MLPRVLRKLKRALVAPVEEDRIDWVQRDPQAWIVREITGKRLASVHCHHAELIESRAQETNQLGEQPLWEGYGKDNASGSNRSPNQVRTWQHMGNFYADLVERRSPEIIVEFGTAFGVSGMYFLSGLEQNGKGKLLSFEPNAIWAEIAQKNLKAISDRFALTVGTFEDNIDHVLPEGEKIDLSFIDAIHTSEFVIPQLELVVERSRPGALVILDDIGFSADMESCWKKVSRDPRFLSSFSIGSRVGVLELKV